MNELYHFSQRHFKYENKHWKTKTFLNAILIFLVACFIVIRSNAVRPPIFHEFLELKQKSKKRTIYSVSEEKLQTFFAFRDE